MDNYPVEKIMAINKKVEGVLKYIKENPNSDPNLYELMELAILTSIAFAGVKNYGAYMGLDKENGYKYAQNHSELSRLRSNFSKMYHTRMEHLVDSNRGLRVTEDSPLYKWIEDTVQPMWTYSRIKWIELDTEEGIKKKEALCSLAGVGLYVKQRKRDLQKSSEKNVIYNNGAELSRLKWLLKGIDVKYAGDRYVEEIINEIESCYMKVYEPESVR